MPKHLWVQLKELFFSLEHILLYFFFFFFCWSCCIVINQEDALEMVFVLWLRRKSELLLWGFPAKVLMGTSSRSCFRGLIMICGWTPTSTGGGWVGYLPFWWKQKSEYIFCINSLWHFGWCFVKLRAQQVLSLSPTKKRSHANFIFLSDNAALQLLWLLSQVKGPFWCATLRSIKAGKKLQFKKSCFDMNSYIKQYFINGWIPYKLDHVITGWNWKTVWECEPSTTTFLFFFLLFFLKVCCGFKWASCQTRCLASFSTWREKKIIHCSDY